MERTLDNWLTGFLYWKRRSEAPLSYRTWVGLSVIAASLQRKCWCKIEGKVFPNMFVVLVGPSGVRKGTAMDPGQAILRAAKIKLASTTVTREGLIRSLSKSEKMIPGQDFINHSSLTVFSKEFTVFLGYQNLQLIADLCDLYDCDEQWEYGVKTEELQDVITNVWLNIIGATTPDSLVSSIPKNIIGGGLTSRMILVYEDKEADIIPDPWNTPNSLEVERNLISDIQKIGLLKGEFKKSKSF